MTRQEFIDMSEPNGNDYAFEELMKKDSRIKFVDDLDVEKFGDLSESNYWFYDGRKNPTPLWGADDVERCGVFKED